MEAITPIAALDPTVMDRIKLEDIPRELWEINGAPADIFNDDADIEQQNLVTVSSILPPGCEQAEQLRQRPQRAGQRR